MFNAYILSYDEMPEVQHRLNCRKHDEVKPQNKNKNKNSKSQIENSKNKK
jgi:hypothetical protein